MGSTSTLASGWASIDDPAIARRGNGALVVVANAIRSTNASDPILNQAMWTSTDDGATWTLFPTDTAYQVYGGDPVSLAFGPDGMTPFTTWDAIVHRGTDPTVANVNLTQSAGWNCCAYWGGIAFAPATNQLVVTWYSNATGHDGVAARQIDPANAGPIGSPVVMPGSSAIATDERTQVVARPCCATVPGRTRPNRRYPPSELRPHYAPGRESAPTRTPLSRRGEWQLAHDRQGPLAAQPRKRPLHR